MKKFALCVLWIFVSSSIILNNKYIIKDLGFPVCTLVLLHQLTTYTLASVTCTTFGIDVPRVGCTENMKTFFILSLLMSVNLYFSNITYHYIDVSLIQMVKAITPVFVLFISLCMQLETFSCKIVCIVVLITSGVFVSSFNDVSITKSAWKTEQGIAFQLVSVLAESFRLCSAKSILQDYNLSPMASLQLIGPNSIVLFFLLSLLMDFNRWKTLPDVHPGLLVLNCSIAFFLNGVSMLLIKETSPLTLNVCGILKDFLLIAWSVEISHNTVTPLQYVGFGVSTLGIVLYTLHKNSVRLPFESEPTELKRLTETKC